MPKNVKPVTHTGITRKDGERIDRLERRPAGGFDPNESPVIIGEGSTSDTGTPDDVSGGALGATVIGGNAPSATGNYSTAIGGGVADGVGAVAIGRTSATGHSSTAVGGSAGAIGDGATALGGGGAGADNAIAIGTAAAADADYAIAVGFNTDAGHVGAVAIGLDATTTTDNQIVLGSPASFVEIPGNGAANGLVLTDTVSGVRYIVQISAGVLVLNAAP